MRQLVADAEGLQGAEVADQVGLAVISTVHPISAIFALPASELPTLTRAGFAKPMPVYAYTSDDKEKLAEGELLTVDSAVDERKRLFAEHLVRYVPLATVIKRSLEERASHRASFSQFA